jgi:hypothetical protein
LCRSNCCVSADAWIKNTHQATVVIILLAIEEIPLTREKNENVENK